MKNSEVIEIFEESNNIVVISGAGISVPSGIPDFRSANSGVWENHDPMKVANIVEFHKNPDAFYDWLEPLVESMKTAEPNDAHLALVELEEMGKLSGIVTQNIDGLHERAGSSNVFPVHGHCNSMTCVSCGEKVQTTKETWDEILEDGTPWCEVCKENDSELSPMKPDVVLFGENLPIEVYDDAIKCLEESDLCVVIGSSLQVAPVSLLPGLAMSMDIPVVIFNIGETMMDDYSLVVQGDVSKTLPAIVKKLQETS